MCALVLSGSCIWPLQLVRKDSCPLRRYSKTGYSANPILTWAGCIYSIQQFHQHRGNNHLAVRGVPLHPRPLEEAVDRISA